MWVFWGPLLRLAEWLGWSFRDRKSTRLNSSHANISYAVFCLKKKKIRQIDGTKEATSCDEVTTIVGHVDMPAPLTRWVTFVKLIRLSSTTDGESVAKPMRMRW